jgi:hypothetical protein
MFMIGFAFDEVMEGSIQKSGERFDRPFRFRVKVHTPNVVARVAMCEAEGTLRLDGLAKDVPATGRLELSPLFERRIRYVLDFTGEDGKRYRFDGSKSLGSGRHPLAYLESWTTLPGEVTDEQGKVWGRAVLRFSMRKHLRGLLWSVRLGPWAHQLPSRGAAHAS